MKDHKITICVGNDFLSYEPKMIIDSDPLDNDEKFRYVFTCEVNNERSKNYQPFWNTSMDLKEARKLRDMLTETINYFENKVENGCA